VRANAQCPFSDGRSSSSLDDLDWRLDGVIFFPFLYALAGLIFVPLGCWIYNIATRIVGDLQVSVVDDADA
jgi:hypothetical protein